jgi:amidohydrolase
MDPQIIDTVRALRQELNALAERAGEERKTKARLIAFLRENTSLRIDDREAFFCAVHEEEGAEETIAFRAELDALPFGDGAAHHCGHDGHMAALAGLGLLLEGKTLGRNVVLLFQHAEEVGGGGKICAEALLEYNVSRVYALHNVPGWAEGAIIVRRGVFACASRGMVFSFTGTPSHAAYPEHGRNPGLAAARLIAPQPGLVTPERYRGLALATLIGADIGTKEFGTAAASAEVRLTLRAWFDDVLNVLIASLKEAAEAEAERDGVSVSVSFCDVFPAVVNDDEAASRLETAARGAGLTVLEAPEPFRWSEDFCYYGPRMKAAMAGVGAGETWAPLHTEDYDFNDAVLPAALTLLSALAAGG